MLRSETGLGIATDLDTFWVTAGLGQEARHWLETTLATGRGAPADRALAMVLLARFCGLQHDLVPARDWAAQAAAAAGDSDHRAQGLLCIFTAMTAAWDGRPDAAVEESARSLELLQGAGDRAAELLALSIHGVCLGLAGDREAAISVFDSAIALAEQTGEMFRRSFCLAGLGELALDDGDHERAEELFLEALRVEGRVWGTGSAWPWPWIRSAVRPWPGTALAVPRSCWALRRRSGTRSGCARPATPSPAARRRSTASATRGSGSASRRSVASSGAARRSRRSRPSRIALGDDLDPVGEPAVLPSPLTRRETEVAELVAEGLSNPEIARRLVISVRTAQGHVENILRKLGFTSRAMIASWVIHRRVQQDQSAPAAP